MIIINFFVGSNLKEWDQIHILASLSYDFLLLMMLGGIALFTIGIIGIARPKIKNHRNLFTAIATVGIPILVFTIVLFAFTLIVAPASFHFPLRSKITNVSVINDSPLILSVDVKAITTRDTRIEGAYILNIEDYNIVSDSYMNPPFFELTATRHRHLFSILMKLFPQEIMFYSLVLGTPIMAVLNLRFHKTQINKCLKF